MRCADLAARASVKFKFTSLKRRIEDLSANTVLRRANLKQRYKVASTERNTIIFYARWGGPQMTDTLLCRFSN